MKYDSNWQPRRQNAGRKTRTTEKEGSLWLKDEALKEKEEEVRKKSATIRTQQAKIQQLGDQLAVSPQVS